MRNNLSRCIAIALALGVATIAMAQETIRRLTQEEATKTATAKFQPEYPSIARQLKLEGSVQVEASIDEKGTVENVRVVSGNIVLANAAVAALKRWRFNPVAIDGKNTRAVAALSFTFKL